MAEINYAVTQMDQSTQQNAAMVEQATYASVDTPSYPEFATGHFLARAFMKYRWDLYAPDKKIRNLPYVSPLRASSAELTGVPPTLVRCATKARLTPASSRAPA